MITIKKKIIIIIIIIIFNQEAPLTNGGFQGGPGNKKNSTPGYENGDQWSVNPRWRLDVYVHICTDILKRTSHEFIKNVVHA